MGNCVPESLDVFPGGVLAQTEPSTCRAQCMRARTAASLSGIPEFCCSLWRAPQCVSLSSIAYGGAGVASKVCREVEINSCSAEPFKTAPPRHHTVTTQDTSRSLLLSQGYQERAYSLSPICLPLFLFYLEKFGKLRGLNPTLISDAHRHQSDSASQGRSLPIWETIWFDTVGCIIADPRILRKLEGTGGSMRHSLLLLERSGAC